MDNSKKVILGIIVLSVFVLIVSVSSLYVQTEITSGNACGCFIPIPLFIPFIASVGLFIGTMVYYMFSPRFEEKKMEKKSICKLFEKNERKVFEVLADEKEVNQAEVVRKSGLSKVKVSRTINKLEEKGVLEKKQIGKINVIRLKEEIAELF